jgi:BirA family biotin operon repressor/biotin-[acetyl-CoA-carboxylase] ligase
MSAPSLGAPLVSLASTTSTSDLAKLAAKEGAPHGATWVADVQTAGRGRQGRAWIAAPGEALLFSVILRVPCAPARLPPLSLVVGLAVRDAVARAAPEALVRIKWPNDVVVGEARLKVAGVLVEASLSGTSVEAIVVGVGVNVHTRAFPPELAAIATSIELAGGATTRSALMSDILASLERDGPLAAARGIGPLHARLTAADALRGARVRSESGEGIAEGIDTEGRLVVRTDDGTIARFTAGEVHLLAKR